MKRNRSTPSQSPPRLTKKEREDESASEKVGTATKEKADAEKEELDKRRTALQTMATQENSPPGPASASLPGRRIAIDSLLADAPIPSRGVTEQVLTYLPRDDLCVKQCFEIYLTYAQALDGRREELAEVQRTLTEADSIIQELGSELEKAENARPRRARIIGPIRTRIQSAQGQREGADERVEAAQTKVAFSENTMLAMQSVLLKFGWLIQHVGGEFSLQPRPGHPAP